MKKLPSTGLEQELNQKEIIGELVFPEIAAVARQMAAEGIVATTKSTVCGATIITSWLHRSCVRSGDIRDL